MEDNLKCAQASVVMVVGRKGTQSLWVSEVERGALMTQAKTVGLCMSMGGQQSTITQMHWLKLDPYRYQTES